MSSILSLGLAQEKDHIIGKYCSSDCYSRKVTACVLCALFFSFVTGTHWLEGKHTGMSISVY